MKKAKKRLAVILYFALVPFLPFAVLLLPYSFVNQKFLVNWLGCGCPQIDEYGNAVYSAFNANDFTALFWLAVCFGAAGVAFVIGKKLPCQKKWLRLIYVAAVFLVALVIRRAFCQMMMWK